MDKQDQQFREIMKNYRPEKAPVNFSKRVMDHIHALPKAVYEPVFGRWFLPVFLGFVALFVLVVLFQSEGSGVGSSPGWLSKIPTAELDAVNHASKSFLAWTEQIPSVLIFALMGIAVLLVVDRLLTRHYRTSVRK